MYLYKSDKARDELSSGTRVLTLRERGALILADGRKTQEDLQLLLRGDGVMLEKLIATGYLICTQEIEARAALLTDEAVDPLLQLEPVLTATPSSSSDNFEGKRSLATTRMFLFDMSERMFARKMPALAQHFRDQLRQARDRDSMMVVAREIIMSIEEIAGPQRADGVSERIGMLLPLNA